MWLNNRLRILIANALSAQRLVSADAAVRLQAASALQREANGEQLPLLARQLARETDPQVHQALSTALANLQLTDGNPQVRFNAVRLLGESGEPETRARLQALTDAAHEPDAAVRAEAQRSLQQVQHRLMIGDLLGGRSAACRSVRSCCWRRSGWRSPTACSASSIWRTAKC